MSAKLYSASYQRPSGQETQTNAANEIKRAIRHPDNFEHILVCTVVFIVVGLLMMVTGGVICLIYYTEITPPNFDSNYHRYVGSSMPRIVGPLLVAFGGLLSAGDLVVIGLTIQQYQKKRNATSNRFNQLQQTRDQTNTAVNT